MGKRSRRAPALTAAAMVILPVPQIFVFLASLLRLSISNLILSERTTLQPHPEVLARLGEPRRMAAHSECPPPISGLPEIGIINCASRQQPTCVVLRDACFARSTG